MRQRLADQEVRTLLKIGEEWYWIQQNVMNWLLLVPTWDQVSTLHD